MAEIQYKPRLMLRIAWKSEFSTGADFARHIYYRLCRDAERPASRGLGIPVYFHTGATPGDAKLNEIDLDAAESTVIIPLLDSSIRANSTWRECIKNLEQRIAGDSKRHLLLPIACEDRTVSIVNRANCIRLYKVDTAERPNRLVADLTHELARLLLGRGSDVETDAFGSLEKSYAPVKLFISHSKHDSEGTIIATELRDYGRTHLPIATFYDSNDIAAGYNFEAEIKANVAESAMVVVHTNVYSDRPWCRKEVLLAKQYGCPLLVVDAVTIGEDRLFPYLGNAPTARWLFDSPLRCERVIDSALREILKNAYFLEHVRTLKRAGMLPKACVEIGTAPEMLTYRNLLRAKKCERAKPSVLLYPDPPLGDEEVEVLEDLDPSNVTFMTPTAIGAQFDPSKPGMFLKKRLVGLSISNSVNLAELGMSIEHLEDAMVECARHLLAQGASLAYGGDLRPGGFTTILCELARNHNRAGSTERIHNFLAWPIYLRNDPTSWQEYMDEIHSYRISPPADLGLDEKVYVAADDLDGRYAWARSLTQMRREMNEKTEARVLLGGQVVGFKGKYPGLFEEALIALRSGKPLYLIGGFGGCTTSIVDALTTGTAAAFTESFQKCDPMYEPIILRYAADAAANRTTPINYAEDVKFLKDTGVGGLNNGLSARENEVLFTTKNIPEIVCLLLKGLTERLR